MKNVLINGYSSKVGGGYVLFDAISKEFAKDKSINWFILKSNKTSINIQGVNIIEVNRLLELILPSPIIYFIIIPFLMFMNKIEAVVNLGDLVIRTKKKQIYYFDWAYYAYPKGIVWKRMSLINLFKRKFKALLIKFNIDSCAVVIVQTKILKKRLQVLHPELEIYVYPNSLSVDKVFLCTPPVILQNLKLLYVTHYYEHKNIEVLLDVALKCKAAKFDVIFTLTIDKDQCRLAKKLINNIHKFKVESYFNIVGKCYGDDLKKLYNSNHAVIIPTLLESYSLSLLEGMYFMRPILTSNRMFCREVCKDSAFYFDPLDPVSIMESISMLSRKDLVNKKLEIGKEIISRHPDWSNISKEIKTNLINNL